MNRPNILFIYSDDTNHEMLGPPFGTSAYTPRLRQLAEEGVRATNFTTVATVCTPSRYAWLTGHYAGRCPGEELRNTAGPGEPYCITWNTKHHPEQEPSIGTLLQDAGYCTGWVGKNHTLPNGAGGGPPVDADADPDDPAVRAALEERYANNQAAVRASGFDEVDGLVIGNPDYQPPVTALQSHNLPWMAHHAAGFLDRRHDDQRPFFLNVALTTLHGPHHVTAGIDADERATPLGYRDEHVGTLPGHESISRRLREAGIEENHLTAGALWMDDLVGHLLDRLAANGQAENTIVIYSADHGNHRLDKCFGKSTVYHAGAHIPFVMRWPGRIHPGTTSDALLQNIDLLPTALGIAGRDVPTDVVCDGVDMLPALTGDAQPRATAFTEYGYGRAVFDGRYQLLAHRLPQRLVDAMKNGETDLAYDIAGKNGAGGCLQYRSYRHYWEPDQLFDLESDPDQQHNRFGDPELAEVQAQLEQALWNQVADLPDAFPRAVDPWLYSDEYRALAEKTTTAKDPMDYYWYREGAY